MVDKRVSCNVKNSRCQVIRPFLSAASVVINKTLAVGQKSSISLQLASIDAGIKVFHRFYATLPPPKIAYASSPSMFNVQRSSIGSPGASK